MKHNKKIKIAVFPIAGMGTRFLPITKTISKEMLNILDRPLLDYAVQEAKAAGIETFIFVTNKENTKPADYFSKNPKSNPMVVTITLLFDYFSKLMVYQVNSDLNPKILSSKIGINPYFLNEFASAGKNYSIKKIVKVISVIREYDMYSKGVKVKKVSPKLLQELVARIASIH